MKNILLMCCLFISACNLLPTTPEEKRAEVSVKKYLDSISSPAKCEIINFEHLHPIYSTYEDDPNYDKYQNDSLKLDSVRRNFKPAIRAWIIYVSYRGKNIYGNYGDHTSQCALNKDLSKMVVGIEVGNGNMP